MFSRKRLIVGLSIFVATVCLIILILNKPATKPSKLVYSVSGMVCSSCSLKVETQLNKISNIVSVSASHQTGEIQIITESKLTENELKKIQQEIEILGYTILNKESKLILLDYNMKPANIKEH